MAIKKDAAQLGIHGEEITAQFLIERGFHILDRNWRIKEGELDIVAKSLDGIIVFVEVKTRTSIAFGDPLESITPEKAMRIQRLALAWLATHQRLGWSYRIDVVGILIGRTGEMTIDYREGIL